MKEKLLTLINKVVGNNKGIKFRLDRYPSAVYYNINLLYIADKRRIALVISTNMIKLELI